MTTPAEQFAAEHNKALADIAKLAAKTQELMEQQSQLDVRISNLEEWKEQCNCGTVDIDPEPEPEPPAPPTLPSGIIPDDLLNRTPDEWQPWKNSWKHDARFVGLRDKVPGGIAVGWIDWGNRVISNSRANRLLIQDSVFTAEDAIGHQGQPWRGWGEYYFWNVIFDGLQWSTESNAGSKRGALIDVTFKNVGEDAVRDVYGHIENIVVESVKPVGRDPHCDTIDWKSNVENAGIIRNVKSTTGHAHGIITAGVKNLVIDGFEHLPPEGAGWSIQFGGYAENITIRNCKLGGDIQFRGGRGPNVVIEDSVRQNVPREEF